MEPHRLHVSRAAGIGLLVALASVVLMPSTSNAAPADARRLLGEYKCYLCHADHETKAGPAYVNVAARFRSRRDAVSVIAAEIRHGLRRGGPWHMPPHPEVSPSEAQAMARYIMALDQRKTSATRP